MLVYEIKEKRSFVPSVLLQSDDWGFFGSSPNFQWCDELLSHVKQNDPGWQRSLCASTVETVESVERLFSVLSDIKDTSGRNPIMQCGVVVGFPDYVRMKSEKFVVYRDRFLPESPPGWPEWRSVLPIMRNAMKEGLFFPFYHGRSHFAVEQWRRSLLAAHPLSMKAFNCNVVLPSFVREGEYGKRHLPMPTETWISNGISAFKELFGISPFSTVSPVYRWTDHEELAFSKVGIRFVQGKNLQVPWMNIPRRIIGKGLAILGLKDSGRYYEIRTGDCNRTGLRYITRNVHFEPLLDGEGCVDKAVSAAMKAWKKEEPAIISTHRFNYCHLDKRLANKSLALLYLFLSKLINSVSRLLFLSDQALFDDRLHFKREFGLRC